MGEASFLEASLILMAGCGRGAGIEPTLVSSEETPPGALGKSEFADIGARKRNPGPRRSKAPLQQVFCTHKPGPAHIGRQVLFRLVQAEEPKLRIRNGHRPPTMRPNMHD